MSPTDDVAKIGFGIQMMNVKEKGFFGFGDIG